jgi:hypothetical protein
VGEEDLNLSKEVLGGISNLEKRVFNKSSPPSDEGACDFVAVGVDLLGYPSTSQGQHSYRFPR